MENPAILLRRLNPYCARAMEGAASLCLTRAHAEILPEHWLLKLLEQGEGDFTVLARRYEWDMDALWQDLLGWLDTLPRSVRSRPQLADSTQTLMREAWMRASLAGEERIRGVHLLMALVDQPKMVRCDGLWPLLTLGQSQLQRLRPLLDTQSDERPEAQQDAELAQNGGEVQFVGRPVGAGIKEGELNPLLQSALDKYTLDVTARAREGSIDPVFGRDTEIRQMVDILSRRRKNNPILVGEPGVGKTALVEGLGLRIAEGNVPEPLKAVSLRTLDLGLLQDIQQSSPLLSVDVDVRTVANVIADWTGVPLSSLMKDEQTELLNLESEIGKRVVGQNAALNAIGQRLRAAKTGLTAENGPQGVFLLVGPSGVGKTETALALADAMYGGEKSLITLNLSEYQEPHTVSQLKGSPPGYVGYGQGGTGQGWTSTVATASRAMPICGCVWRSRMPVIIMASMRRCLMVLKFR
ncbi:Chaperone protein ClpB [compost metagenome]